ncbi:MAG: hypothetical protein ACP5HS_14915 [Anaerolineae bacterium]
MAKYNVMSLDDLFREAFQPIVEATPPEDAWRRIVRSLEREVGSSFFVYVNKVLDWIQGLQTAYRYASDGFVYAQIYGLYGPPLWRGALAQ